MIINSNELIQRRVMCIIVSTLVVLWSKGATLKEEDNEKWRSERREERRGKNAVK